MATMVGAVAATKSAGTRILLITNNVSGLCGDLEAFLPNWLAVLTALVKSKNADFIALHLQEVGGSAWKTVGAGVAAETLAHAISAAFPDYWSSGMFINLDTANDFSALGNVYLVRAHESLL